MKSTCIYGLKDPADEQIHYIGKSDRPEARLRQHLSERGINPAKEAWLGALKAKGQRPELVILDKVPGDEWLELERWWIAQGIAKGWPLTNIVGNEDWLANYDRFQYFAPYLSEAAWNVYASLPDAQRGEICRLTAMEMMQFSPVALKARGGTAEHHLGMEGMIGKIAAERLVQCTSNSRAYETLTQDIETAGKRLVAAVDEYIDCKYGMQKCRGGQTATVPE